MERQILGIKIKDRISLEYIRNQTDVKNVVEHVSKQKWSLAGHIMREIVNRLTRKILELQPREGQKGIGRPPLRCVDDIRNTVGRQW